MFNQTSDAMLGKLRQATAGMADDTTLMANVNALLTMGLADNVDALAKHFEIVTKLKKPTDDIASAMENWALLMANQSIPRLDSFGISSGKVRDRIKELQAANKGMNRETAFTIATLEQAEIAMAKVADQTQGTAADLERLNTEWANLTTILIELSKHTMARCPMASGTVKFFDRIKGWGFIVPDDGGPQVFVHYTGIDGEGYRNLYENDRVEYQLVDRGRGPQAQRVRRLHQYGVTR